MTLSGEGSGVGGETLLPSPPHPITPVIFNSEAAPQPQSAVSRPRPRPASALNSINGSDDVDEGLTAAKTGGKGLWSLWTRNFKSPLLMLLDLVDNAVDAAMHRKESAFLGRVQIYRDLYEVMDGQTYTTGLCIRNNSMRKIAPLKEVLQLFISAKADSGSDSIGENGVGLKQSCAALSDLSFVLIKNGPNKFEFGILAKALQREDAVILPCFKFEDGHGGQTIGGQMLEMFTKPQYKEVANCIAEYGRVRSGGNPSLARGVARLGNHFEDINLNFFDSEYVFEVIIDKVMHRGNSIEIDGKNTAVRDIINEMQREIPRRYLHIPDDSFKFCVGKKELTFKYWPERLVEFTKIHIPVRYETPWSQNFGEETHDSYHIGVYLGFDRYRISDPVAGVKKQKKACSLYIYSRGSGRLIQYEPDARITLGLNLGGTDYCQALTVIIDDTDGRLPLDPTKQGIAFGNQPQGHVHEENLYSVVSCVVKFYYMYHKNKFGGSKKMLSAKIAEFIDSDLSDNLKTCSNSELTDYGVLFYKTKDDRIQVDRTSEEEEIIGPDTMFRLLPDTRNGRKATTGKLPTKRTSSTLAKKQEAAPASKVPPKRKQLVTKTNKSPARKKQPVAKASKPAAREKRPITEASKPPAKKRHPTAEAGKPTARKKRPVADGSKPPAKRKQPNGTTPCPTIGPGWTQQILARKSANGRNQSSYLHYFSPNGRRFRSMAGVTRFLESREEDVMKEQGSGKKKGRVASKSTSRKKRPMAKVSKPPPKRNKPTARADKATAERKQCSAMVAGLPREMSGARSSSRQNSGKPPQRYGREESESESDSDPGSNDSDEDYSNKNTTRIKIETLQNGGVINEDPIDLCFSSEDEDEVIKEEAPSNASSKLSANENEPNDADETEIENVTAEEVTDVKSIQAENEEVEGINEGAPVHADIISSNTPINETEAGGTAIDNVAVEEATGGATPQVQNEEDEATNQEASVPADIVLSNSPANETETNVVDQPEIGNMVGEQAIDAIMVGAMAREEAADGATPQVQNEEDEATNQGAPVLADIVLSNSPVNETETNEADEPEMGNMAGEQAVDAIMVGVVAREIATDGTSHQVEIGEREATNQGAPVLASIVSSNSPVNENETNDAVEAEMGNMAGGEATDGATHQTENEENEATNQGTPVLADIVLSNSPVNETETKEAGEAELGYMAGEQAIDAKSLQIENAELKSKVVGLNERLSSRDTKIESLENQIKSLRDEVESSKCSISVIQRR